MKNKTVKMVLAVVVLGVCCGAYAGVKTYVAHQEQKESEEDSEESTTVFTASTDNIKSLDFMVDDTETTFEKDDDSCVKKDETDFPVNQTTLDSAASAIASVDSNRVLEDVDDLSEYGLDSPSNTIKIVTKSDEEDGDDITTTLYVGDENSSTSQYYVRNVDDEKTVYLIDSSCVEPFTKSLNDYAQMDDFPAISNTDTITKISVDGDNSYELSKDEDTSTWSVKGSEDEEKADSATVSSLVSSFGSMAYSSLADYKCDDKSKYGLDKPYATITVDYQEEVADDAEQDTESDESVNETTDETSEAEDTDGEEAEDETEKENLKVDYVVKTAGDTINFGEAKMTFYGPLENDYQYGRKVDLNTRQENKYSIVTKIVYGSNSFLMTGDAQKVTIEKIIAKGYDLTAQVV